MKYINAKNLLPDALVKELQSYIQGGYLYVPADQAQQKRWGEASGYGLNTQRLGRELLTTSEITTMPGNKCLLQLRGLPPFFSPKYDLKQHPNYRYTAEHDSKRNAFHLERLTSRRLRLKPEEEYTVYEVDASDEDADILNYDDLDSADDFV